MHYALQKGSTQWHEQPPSRRSRWLSSIHNSLCTNKIHRILSARRRGIDCLFSVIRTTIVHFLVFSQRFSLWFSASAWHPLHLAKRWQPPSRRSRWHYSWEMSYFTILSSGYRRPGGEASVYSVCSVDSKMLIFRAFRAFRGSNLCFGCGLTAPGLSWFI